MIKKPACLFAVALLMVVVAAGCGSSTSTPSKSTAGSASKSGAGSPIVIGLSIALTGAEAIPSLARGYKEAVSEADAAGGITVAGVRHPVNLTVLDNRSDPSLMAQQVHTLVLQDHAVALVSGCCDLNVTEAPLANALRVPLVGTDIPTDLMVKVNGKYSWDILVSLESDVGSYFTKDLPSLGQTDRKVALIANNNPQGEGENALYAAFAKAANYQVTATALVPSGTTDFSSFINKAISSHADNLVAQMAQPDCFALWKQMKSLGYKPKTAVANQCGPNPTWRGLGALGDGALVGQDWTSTSGLPEAAKMSSVFGAIYPNDVADEGTAVNSYTTMEVLLDAIERAGSTAPAKINAAVGQTNGPFPLGTIKFDAHNNWSGTIFLAQWQNGKLNQVYPAVPGVHVQFPVSGLAG